MKILLDINQYQEAIRFIETNNICYQGDVREALDKLIVSAFKCRGTVSSLGISVACYDFNEEETSATVDITVSPSIGKDAFFMEMHYD